MTDIFDIQVSYLGTFYDNEPLIRTMRDVVEMMNSSECRRLTAQIRELKAKAENPATPIADATKAKEQADKLKRQLPSFMTNVVCRDGKTRKNIVEFLPMVGFDVDHLNTDQVDALMNKLKHDPHVVIAQPSCSGKGIHFVLLTDAGEWLTEKWAAKSTSAFNYVYQNTKEYAEVLIETKVDEKCNNPERIFGICGDDRLFVNHNPLALHIDTGQYIEPVVKPVSSYAMTPSSGTYHASINEVATEIIQRIEEKGVHFASGSRNNFVLRFAYACNKYGVNQSETEDFCICNFAEHDFTDSEIRATIRSAYSKSLEHGTLCAPCAYAQQYAKTQDKTNSMISSNGTIHEQDCADAQTAQKCKTEEMEITFHQTFSDKIAAEDWCPYMKTVLDCMDDTEGKDKMILATLVLNSGMIPNYYGVYGGHTVYPPLYLITYGPSASRKGEISSCIGIVRPLKNEIIGQYQQEMEIYKSAHAEWESKGAKAADKAERGEEPKEPEYRTPIIPANSSASAAYQALNNNGGWGIMFETEASTLKNSLCSDYGNYSDGLLKAFHHENIPMNRVKDKLHFDIENPRLAVCLTCTPGLLPKLFPTFEEGLGNRFLFYGLNRKLEWRNPFMKREKTLDETFEELGQKSLELYHQMKDLGERKIQFLLSDKQIDDFNAFFSDLLMEQFDMLGDGITAFIFRLGISTFRIAQTLSILRRYSEWDKSKPLFADNEQALICNDKDISTALTIMNTLVNHTATIFAALFKDDEGLGHTELAKMTPPERTLFDALQDSFTTDDVRIAANDNHINVETARRYIGKFVNEYRVAERIKNGYFHKCLK